MDTSLALTSRLDQARALLDAYAHLPEEVGLGDMRLAIMRETILSSTDLGQLDEYIVSLGSTLENMMMHMEDTSSNIHKYIRQDQESQEKHIDTQKASLLFSQF